jgi:hypothetical protein
LSIVVAACGLVMLQEASLVRWRGDLCGVQLYNIDWSGTSAKLGAGHLLAWFGGGQQPAFSMHCNNGSSTGAINCGCGANFELPHQHFDVREGTSTLFSVATQASVINPTCLQANVHSSAGLHHCLLEEGSQAQVVPAAGGAEGAARSSYSVFAGDAVNLTVGIGPNITKRAVIASQHDASLRVSWPPCGNMSAQLSNTSRSANDNLAVMHLKQDRTGKLFVIGKPTAIVDDSGFAHFCDMALQPIDPPLHNRNYTFSFEPDRTSGLYAQVPDLQVTVQLLRCTLGQHMTVRLCTHSCTTVVRDATAAAAPGHPAAAAWAEVNFLF